MAETQLTSVAPGVREAAELSADSADEALTSRASRASGLSRRTLVQGAAGSLAILVGCLGAGGDLIHDPILGASPFSWIRYGHGQQLAQAVLYIGVGLLIWAWVRLGRDVIAKRVTPRGVLLTGLSWVAPMVIAPPTFTRDVFSYLGQGELSLLGFNPYTVGPSVLGDSIAQNVHPFWQGTPAPYGPLFILLAKGVASVVGENLIAGVILMRLVLMIGLLLLVLALPGLTRHLGGRLSVALWLMLASPMTVIHLVGGPHNDLLMIGLLAMGVLLVLDGKHVAGVGVVTLGMAVKATAGVALPFLIWVWAARLEGTAKRRFVRAASATIGVVAVVFGACMAAAKVDFGWIGALHAPTMIVNWVNLPTGIGELTHSIVGWFGDLSEEPFDNMFRFFGLVALGVVVIVQWWRARNGGPDAVRRGSVVLLAVAILAPPTLPWYLTWGLVLFACTPWKRNWLAFTAGLAVLILLVYYPNGEGAMGDLSHMIWVILAAILTGVSMLKVDPLGLRAKPDDHGTLAGDVSSAVSTVGVSGAAPADDAAAEPELAAADVAEAPVDEPLPSGPAPG